MDPIVIMPPRGEILLVRFEVVDQHRPVFVRLIPAKPLLVPVADLRPQKHAGNDDREIDRHREPIVVHHMFADPADDHRYPKPFRSPFDPMLTLLGELSSGNWGMKHGRR